MPVELKGRTPSNAVVLTGSTGVLYQLCMYSVSQDGQCKDVSVLADFEGDNLIPLEEGRGKKSEM